MSIILQVLTEITTRVAAFEDTWVIMLAPIALEPGIKHMSQVFRRSLESAGALYH